MKIKILLSTFLLLCASLNVFSQDIIITKGGEFIEAFELEEAGNAFYYRLSPKKEDAIQRIEKDDLFMIKKKDGTTRALKNNLFSNNRPKQSL